MTERIKFLELKLRTLEDNMERVKIEHRIKIKTAYINKFKINDKMTEEEKKVINQNIQERRDRAKANYNRPENEGKREKHIKRVKARQKLVKEEQNSKGDNTSLVSHNSPSHKI